MRLRPEGCEGGGWMRLLACVREKRNSKFSRDTQSSSVGKELEGRVMRTNMNLYDDEVPRNVENIMNRLDTRDTEREWWSEKQESDKELMLRMHEMNRWIMNSTAEQVIVVGHSHFFRMFCRTHLSAQCRQAQPELCRNLDKNKIKNGGVLALRMSFGQCLSTDSRGLDRDSHTVSPFGFIEEAKLLFSQEMDPD